MDADDSVRMLAYALDMEPDTVFAQISYPLFTSIKNEAEETMKILNIFLPDGAWAKEWTPRKAIVGVGVMDPKGGHRFADLKRQESGVADPLLARAKVELNEIMDAVTQNELPHCGDISNRLYPSLFSPQN
ncbi:MAG: hypothetical protein IPG76_00295 [Acidobacteria bacterium]|nr:hypothetical protein [Acidobacteriota bacterium]